MKKSLDNGEKTDILSQENSIHLIKSGGGNGPMKPGNLRKQGAKSGGKSRDEETLFHARRRSVRVLFCV